MRIESEEERNGAQLCRGTSGSVVALSKAHKFPNRWKMHFSNRAPGRFAQVDSLADPKNTLLFTVSLHLCTRGSTSLIQRLSTRDTISCFVQFSMDRGNKNLLQLSSNLRPTQTCTILFIWNDSGRENFKTESRMLLTKKII